MVCGARTHRHSMMGMVCIGGYVRYLLSIAVIHSIAISLAVPVVIYSRIHCDNPRTTFFIVHCAYMNAHTNTQNTLYSLRRIDFPPFVLHATTQQFQHVKPPPSVSLGVLLMIAAYSCRLFATDNTVNTRTQTPTHNSPEHRRRKRKKLNSNKH